MLVWMVGLKVGMIVGSVDIVSGLEALVQSELAVAQCLLVPKLRGSDSSSRRVRQSWEEA
jgi:hypothetical protein